MSVLMVSPEGAQANVSTTESEYLKTLGWRVRTWEEFDQLVKAKMSKVEVVAEPATIDAPAVPRRMGRPKKTESV